MQNDQRQIFNKIDIAIRDEKIRLQYKYLRNCLGLSSIEARKRLTEIEFISWDGRKYYLSEKTIQHVIYDIKQTEVCIEESKESNN